MQSPLATLAVLALLGAGFAVTGDLRRLADRGTRFLNATTVPAGQADAAPDAPFPLPAAPLQPVAPPASPVIGQAAPSASPSPADHRDAPLGRPVEVGRLPTSTLESVDIGRLAPGARLTVWVGTPPAPVAFDIVDPATGEVLEQVASPSGGGQQSIARRLRLESAAQRPTRIDLGGTLRMIPLGVAYGGRPAGPAETLGPVRAIEVK